MGHRLEKSAEYTRPGDEVVAVFQQDHQPAVETDGAPPDTTEENEQVMSHRLGQDRAADQTERRAVSGEIKRNSSAAGRSGVASVELKGLSSVDILFYIHFNIGS